MMLSVRPMQPMIRTSLGSSTPVHFINLLFLSKSEGRGGEGRRTLERGESLD